MNSEKVRSSVEGIAANRVREVCAQVKTERASESAQQKRAASETATAKRGE